MIEVRKGFLSGELPEYTHSTMENLNKQQLVLVALLVSFVTSIATGIVTVSLMDQAPPAVTQTINRVVERTVEKVVQAPNQAAAVVTKETVVIKADDLVVDAVERNSLSVVRVRSTLQQNEGGPKTFEGMGVNVLPRGVIAADASSLQPFVNAEGNAIGIKVYSALLSNGKEVALRPIGKHAETGIAFFEIVKAGDEKIELPVPKFGDAYRLKLGQAVISLGGERDNTVQSGIVATILTRKVEEKGQAGSEPKLMTVIHGIDTDIKANPVLGSTLLNLSGEIIGFYGGARVGKAYLPVNYLTDAMKAVLTEKSSDSNSQ